MAGDWIKMRGALLEHPKLIAIARALHKDKEFRAWLTPGGPGPVNGQIISDRALRCVTAALLMRVWSVSREHGEFVENDLLLKHSEILDLDQMAGAPGVGQAMESVHWAVPENGVTLPNFKEFNVPMTPAEKQKKYRSRNESGNENVTPPLPKRGNENSENVTTREEKRREEVKSKSLSAKSLTDIGVPEQAARDWLAVRKAKRAPLTATALEDLKREAGKAGISVAQAVVICARRSWRGFNASWNWREEPAQAAPGERRAVV